MNPFFHPPIYAAFTRLFWVAVLFLASSPFAKTQDLPRPSASRAKDADGAFSRPYNLKLGPVALTAGADFGLEYVDNVNLSATDHTGDLILRPSVSLRAVWQVTRLNNIELQTSIGYTKYLSHPELDSQSALISPDSALKFNIFIGDVKIVLREQFSFQDEPVSTGAVSNVAKLSRFTNDIGATALWDLNDVVWTLGYDHLNLITTGNAESTQGDLSNNLSVLDRSTDQITSSVFLKLAPTIGLGTEGTVAYNRYPKNPRADSTTYSLGPFIDFQLTPYTRFIISGGYELYSSEGGGSSSNLPTLNSSNGLGSIAGLNGFGVQPRSSLAGNSGSDGSGFYFTLAITHRLNRFYSDRLSAGRDFQIGLLSDRVESTFASYGSTFQLTRRISLGTTVSYEHVTQTSQFERAFGGASLPDYEIFSLGFNTSYQITRKLTVGATYSFTDRTSKTAGQDYTQNRVALEFGYRF